MINEGVDDSGYGRYRAYPTLKKWSQEKKQVLVVQYDYDNEEVSIRKSDVVQNPQDDEEWFIGNRYWSIGDFTISNAAGTILTIAAVNDSTLTIIIDESLTH